MPCREHDLGTPRCENMVRICHSTQSLSAAHSSSSSRSEQSLQGHCLQFLEQLFQDSILCLSQRDEKYHLIAFFCAQIMIYQIRNVTENSEVIINIFFFYACPEKMFLEKALQGWIGITLSMPCLYFPVLIHRELSFCFRAIFLSGPIVKLRGCVSKSECKFL